MTLDNILSAAGLTRFLVRLGYPDSAVLATVRKRHPTADHDQLLAAAKAQKAESDKQLQADLDREALEQEHRP